MKTNTITVTLTDRQAWSVAQYLKRVTFDDVLRRTDGSGDESEAYAMLDGMAEVERALRNAGYAPR